MRQLYLKLSTHASRAESWRMTGQDVSRLSTFHTAGLRNIIRIFWVSTESCLPCVTMTTCPLTFTENAVRDVIRIEADIAQHKDSCLVDTRREMETWTPKGNTENSGGGVEQNEPSLGIIQQTAGDRQK